MKKYLTTLLALLVAGISAIAQMANPQEPLKNDPAVRIGKLENGLTYYIRHNTKPEKRAEFYLFTNVGAIQENERQAGLAHFLEHMALNGTKNLPGKMLISYLESIGCNFGRNINASTGMEQTMYMLNNIPMLREGVLDTCLLIMHDYAALVTNDPVEIDKERGVIIEELRTRRTAQWRMFEGALPYLYKGSKYAECNLIGTIEGLSTFPARELVDFYETWYRPDHQAVIVVGDIDVDQVESKLIALFQDIPAPATPSPKKVIPIPENDDPIIGIVTDPEAQSTGIVFIIKSEPIPNQMRSLGMIYMVDMFKSFISHMMNDRFQEIAQKPDAPFLGANLMFTSLTTSVDATYFSLASKDGEGLTAFEALMTEVEKMRRYGFTGSELERAKTNYLRHLEQAAENTSDRMNSEFINAIINNFAFNGPILDPVYELEVAKGYLPFIQIDQINQLAQQVITPENRIVLFTSPARKDLSIPAQQDIMEVLNKMEDIEIEAYQEEVSDEPIVNTEAIVPGKIIKEKPGAFESIEWTLSNGVKVIVKPTMHKKDEVLFSMQNDGGLSILSEDLLPSVENNVFTLWVQSNGVGNFNATALKRKLTGKIASARPFIGGYTQGINGSASPQDIQTLLELVYAHIVTPRFVESEFEAPMAQLKAIVPNLEKNPNFALQKEIFKTLYNDNPRSQIVSGELLEKVSLADLERAYRLCFGNANGAVVTIVGNVDPANLKPLVELYLGSLPAATKPAVWIKNDNRIQKGNVQNHFKVAMETPKTTIVNVYSADLEYNLKNDVYMDAVKSILDQAYIKSLREDEGGTYGASVQTISTENPVEHAAFLIMFDTDTEKQERMRQIVEADVMNLVENGPSEEYVNKTKENFLKNRQENLIRNNFWLEVLNSYYCDDIDIYTDYDQLVKEITPANVRKFITGFIGQGNFIDISMNPAQ
ncbi:MAG: insulinase family protein [Bacteroidales bacterium]|jgi:zinc protease|nr:insulinase family protein [Bacteroidales bacterium]MDD2264475.1 insulinase family protein [Bacteroidales bacterium]MDD2831710.1 insulinase family protein [Bacteroidales bacterium]MDD3208937.1 insulinase family protein [Bacteroidales bacterium]MDD3697691.1 insulinase family protein [Bacteroidales bacterium]